jgi:hypothetical protein
MNRRPFLIPAIVAAMLLCSGCPSEVSDLTPEERIFITNSSNGIFQDGKYLMKYVQENHQECINKTRRNYRIQNDSQTELVNISCGSQIALDAEVICSVDYISTRSFFERSLSFRVIKIDYTSSTAWLWNQDEGMGLIVPTM